MSTSILTRIVLLIKSSAGVDFTFLNVSGIFILGVFYDMVNAVYFSLPLALYLWLLPERLFRRPGHRIVLYALFFIFSLILFFNGVAEWLFWDEFSVRFNFIAVDYLIYTTEVVGNIQQSYPLEWIIVAIALLSAFSVLLLKKRIDNAAEYTIPFKQRSILMAAYVVVFALLLCCVSNKYHQFSRNAYVNELAGNGIYELFSAYHHNALDYEQFYRKLDSEKAFDLMHELVRTPEAEFTNAGPESLERTIIHTGPEKKLNVVLISVESLSAEFMGVFGNTDGITPFLDSLAGRSLVFTNLYATGTRTVRGLEALTLCVPPTPGQSIVRRPNNEDLFSLGRIFRGKGYQSEYFYGGYGYFDNMSYFFGNNGYRVVDRSALKKEEIDYENIWGVADEDLFDLALREIDAGVKKSPVFTHIMTTSNHRPYTYPDGRIDIPSHTSRGGAVKYTDYAIGRFIRKASKQPWFGNTVFVIVADHCASSAGKTELPVDKYHIPLLVYAPGHVQAGVMERLMSQVDVGPTLLGMLNFSYTSKFYGYDMFTLEPGRERAFISTYQCLGYLKGGKLVTLSPQANVSVVEYAHTHNYAYAQSDEQLVNEAIAWYQTASYAFKHGMMN